MNPPNTKNPENADRQVVAYTASDGRRTLLICEAECLWLVLVAPATVCSKMNVCFLVTD